MTIERIFTCPPTATDQISHEHVWLVAGSGIVGDRYFACRDEPGQNVTFVEAEEIEAFVAETGRPHDLSITRRNFVTRGVRLDALIGREFRVGMVRFRGIERCEPCAGLGAALPLPTQPVAAVVRRLAHRAGLRADVLNDGEVRIGAVLQIGETPGAVTEASNAAAVIAR